MSGNRTLSDSGNRSVLVVFHEDAPGGATRSVLRAVPHLQERGWSFSFWVSRPSELFEELSAAGYEVGGAPRQVGFSLTWLRQPPGPGVKLRAMPTYFRELGDEIRSRRPALVHANSLYSLADGVLARSLRTPVVFHVHEMLRGWKGAAARAVAHSAGMEVVGVSTACAERLRWRGKVPRIAYESSEVPSVIARGGRDRLVVGTVGYVCTRKGTDIFVEAARRAGRADPSIEFRIIGENAPSPEWDWGEQVLNEARELGIVHQPRADVFRELEDWDMLVLPSRHDPFPLVVLEAMASGLPVVGARLDGIAEQITPETGLLAAPGDPDSFARSILELAADPERRRRMGRAGRERVIANFTPERQAASLDAAYRAGLSG